MPPKTNTQKLATPKREKRDPGAPKLTCLPCRDSHKKCEGTTPSCKRCIDQGKQCFYEIKVADEETMRSVQDIEALTSQLNEMRRLNEEKMTRIARMEHERAIHKRNFTQMSNQISDRATVLFDSSDNTNSFLERYNSFLGPMTKNSMPYKKLTEFLHDKDRARLAAMYAMLANGALIVGEMKISKKFFEEAKSSIIDTIEQATASNLHFYTSALIDLGTHCMGFCDLHNARNFFYKLVYLLHDFSALVFSNDSNHYNNAHLSTSTELSLIRNNSPNQVSNILLYHLGYAYQSLLTITCDEELDYLLQHIQLNRALVTYHAEVNDLRIHLDKLNQIVTTFIKVNPQPFNTRAFLQEVDVCKERLKLIDPVHSAYVVGLEKVVRAHAHLAAKNEVEASQCIDDMVKYATTLLVPNKANVLGFALLFSASYCCSYLRDSARLEYLRTVILSHSSGVDLAQICLSEFGTMVAGNGRVNPFFEKFTMALDGRQGARLQQSDLFRFTRAGTPQTLWEQLCLYCSRT